MPAHINFNCVIIMKCYIEHQSMITTPFMKFNTDLAFKKLATGKPDFFF